MKTIAFVAALLVAASVSAQATTTDPATDERGASAKKASSAKPAVAAPTPVVDSPLVKAARRAGAKKSTKKVITNETLKEMNKGHITTTTIKTEVLAPVSAEAESDKAYQEGVQKQREADAAKAKEAEAKKAEEVRRIDRLRRAAAAAEDGDAWLDGDPAALEELQKTAGEPAKP